MKRLKRSLSLRSSRRRIPESQRPQVWENDSYKVRNGGVSFPVKYVGAIEVTESRGTQVCAEAFRKMRDAGVHKKKRMNLLVTSDCIRVVDEETKSLTIDQTIEKVSFCTPDPSDDRVFSYICREGTTRRWMCHCFIAVRDTGERLSHAVGCAFTACLQRKQKAQALQQSTKTKEDVPGSHPDGQPATTSTQPQTSQQQITTQVSTTTSSASSAAGGSMVMNGPTTVPSTAAPQPMLASSPQQALPVQPALKPPPAINRPRTQPFVPSQFTRHMSLRYRSTPMSLMPLRETNGKGGYATLEEDPGAQAPKLPTTVDALGLHTSPGPVQPAQPVMQPNMMSTAGFSAMPAAPVMASGASPMFNGMHATTPALQQQYTAQTSPQYVAQQPAKKQWGQVTPQQHKSVERKLSDADLWLANAEGTRKDATSNQGLLATHNPFSDTATQLNALSSAWSQDLHAALPAANPSPNGPWGGGPGVQQIQEDDEFASLATRHTGSPTGSPRSPATNPFNTGSQVHWV